MDHLTDKQLAHLTQLAQAATPGPWLVGRYREGQGPWMPTVGHDGPGASICRFRRPGAPHKDAADAAYMAAANPQVLQQLLSELQEYRSAAGKTGERLPDSEYLHPLDPKHEAQLPPAAEDQLIWYAEQIALQGMVPMAKRLIPLVRCIVWQALEQERNPEPAPVPEAGFYEAQTKLESYLVYCDGREVFHPDGHPCADVILGYTPAMPSLREQSQILGNVAFVLEQRELRTQ